MDLSSKPSFPFSPQKLCMQGAPWQAATVWTASDDVFLNPVPAAFIWPSLVLVAEDVLNGQPLTTLLMILRHSWYCFSYLWFGFFFLEDYKEAFLCLSKMTARVIKLFQFCCFILTWGDRHCPQFWYSDSSLFLLIIPSPGFPSLGTELLF